jgi:hypothetical protein
MIDVREVDRKRRTSMDNLSRRNALRFALLSAAALGSSLASAGENGATLAIGGYDPVAYFTLGRPTPGVPGIEFEWDEHLYRFASVEHREMFKADPVRYAPQFANYCAMALSLGELVMADPDNWLVTEGKLYIFGKREGPERFQRDLDGNVGRANQNRTLTLRP